MPPSADYYSFENYYANLHVLPGCKLKYMLTYPWSEFRIVEDAVLDGIKDIKTSEGDVTADGKTYDISGRLVKDSSRPGIHIRNGKKYVAK